MAVFRFRHKEKSMSPADIKLYDFALSGHSHRAG
ncbi:Uncharacterised protein [Chromobacterium violaceum]|uniref:Uncharacterized protein n=1 Tax=Chromobacterium violaceum TaxID=536 RepID=A0A3S4JW30_CHRVL|nr:Uncharacterised protein [Chromobacterium violaceum]